MAKKRKSGFNLNDPATLIGFIIGIIGTYVFGLWTGVLILIVSTIVYLLIDSKKASNYIVGGLVGLLIGWLIVMFIGALYKLF